MILVMVEDTNNDTGEDSDSDDNELDDSTVDDAKTPLYNVVPFGGFTIQQAESVIDLTLYSFADTGHSRHVR